MYEIIKNSLYITLFGTLSSGIGGAIGGIFNIKNKSVNSMLYQITSGIMTGIVCFEMLPESFKIANISFSIIGIFLGSFIVYMLDKMVKIIHIKINNSSIIALVIMISMSFHNIIEGIAIGASFVFSFSLGFSILISIFLHDIPEGMIVGVTNKVSKKNTVISITVSLIVGAFTGIGGLIGGVIGNINNEFISLSLSIASGAMLYIVVCELIPEANNNTNNKLIYMLYICGILVGGIITKI